MVSKSSSLPGQPFGPWSPFESRAPGGNNVRSTPLPHGRITAQGPGWDKRRGSGRPLAVGPIASSPTAVAPPGRPLGSALGRFGLLLVDDEGLVLLQDHVLAEDHLPRRLLRGDLVHDVEHRPLDHGAQPPGARLVA